MFSSFPTNAMDTLEWPWAKYETFYKDLFGRELGADNLEEWMIDWSAINKLVNEVSNRLYVATTLDTTDNEAEKLYYRFLEEIYPASEAACQKLKEKLLESGLEPENFEVQLRNMRTEAALFREENLPLLAVEKKMNNAYDKIVGAQTVIWEGKEVTLPMLQPVYQDTDRNVRETAWRLEMSRWLEDRKAINELWVKFMGLRGMLAKNAGCESYRDYRWQQMLRLDYTPEDCLEFDKAIEQVAVPAAVRTYDRRRERLRVDRLRPWDLYVDPLARDPLRPFQDDNELQNKSSAIFHKVDPELGAYFDVMREERLLDLENRKGKAPGAYCIEYLVAERPFIFMNAVGLHEDVATVLHEIGHAFHVLESVHLPYFQQLQYGNEIAEVASTSMELLAAPYLLEDEGGFYSMKDAARARIEHLENFLLFWPYMAVVDSFQHWVYEYHDVASGPDNCDVKWRELWDRYMKGVDWSGLDEEKVTGWHRKLHIHTDPFYYVEYGLAQLGAVQIWANAITDQAGAVKQYRYALSLGGTKTLPELFKAAGAKLSFDAGTLAESVALIERTIGDLESI